MWPQWPRIGQRMLPKWRRRREVAKINMAIAGEQREIDKNYRTIGEWFVSEYEGQIPDAVRELVDAVTASKAKIAELEATITDQKALVERLRKALFAKRRIVRRMNLPPASAKSCSV